MMKTIIFLGPTLPHAEAHSLLSATYLPPVAQGDVYRAAQERPWAIGIIDGYFETQPAVWHKEILWALKEGIHVFGAASMGALRATELEVYGMEGVGQVFAAYRSGELTDDDEIAVIHGALEQAYRAQSDALVDIRATIAKAQRAQLVTDAAASELIALAKRLHYSERSYQRLWSDAQDVMPADELARLATWVTTQRVSQKSDDARALLVHMAALRAERAEPKRVSFVFEHTDAFEQLVQRERAQTPLSAEHTASAAVLDELRLEPQRYAALAEAAFARLLALRVAQRWQVEADDSAYRECVQAYRLARGLMDGEATQAWLSQQGLDVDQFAQLMRQEVQATQVRATLARELEQSLVEVLKLRGEYAPLAERVAHKEEQLLAHGGAEAALPSDTDLLAWYARLVSPTLAPAELVTALQFRDAYALLKAARREFSYRHIAQRDEGDADEEELIHR